MPAERRWGPACPMRRHVRAAPRRWHANLRGPGGVKEVVGCRGAEASSEAQGREHAHVPRRLFGLVGGDFGLPRAPVLRWPVVGPRPCARLEDFLLRAAGRRGKERD